MLRIGVDTGGTFTDAVAVTDAGQVVVGKALSTPRHVEEGVLDALTLIADQLGQGLPELLAATDVLAHGTTVGLNTLLTRTGAQVGLVTTKGFESTLAIAKANKLRGLHQQDLHVPVRWEKPHQLIDRTFVVGASERIDAGGQVVEKLDEPALRAALHQLWSRGARSIAVALLWSVVNPVHERRIREIVRDVLPEAHVTLSSDLAPRIGEYERTSTVVLDAYVAPLVASYLKRLEADLEARGFAGMLVVMRMGGGVQGVEAARKAPIQTLRSGPAGGVAAAQKLGAALGHRHVIATDVGGTSFDVGLVIDGTPQYTRQPMIDRQALAIPAVDIESIGTGGGSIAWFDEDLGALRVGPESAGASPGPACYALGGTRPTVTDAAAVLGYVDRLGGSLKLDVDAAAFAIERDIGRPMGLDVHAAAEGIVEVACEQMRDLIRRATIQRGYNPADFALFVYGGAGPQYAGRYADGLGVVEVIVPNLAAEFSAFGAIASDLRASEERDLRPAPLRSSIHVVNRALEEVEQAVRRQLTSVDRFAQRAGAVSEVHRAVGLRFYRQVHRIDVPVPEGAIGPHEAERLVAEFRDRYERIVGPGSAPGDTPVEVVAVSAEAVLPVPLAIPPVRGSAVVGARRSRPAWFDHVEVPTPVYWWDELGADQKIDGPALIDSATTTVVVFPHQRAVVDSTGDIRLLLEGGS